MENARAPLQTKCLAALEAEARGDEGWGGVGRGGCGGGGVVDEGGRGGRGLGRGVSSRGVGKGEGEEGEGGGGEEERGGRWLTVAYSASAGRGVARGEGRGSGERANGRAGERADVLPLDGRACTSVSDHPPPPPLAHTTYPTTTLAPFASPVRHLRRRLICHPTDNPTHPTQCHTSTLKSLNVIEHFNLYLFFLLFNHLLLFFSNVHF